MPLHLACLHGPAPVPLQFMEALIGTFPEAARFRNHEGNLPIHLACECMEFSPRFRLEEEGVLIMLIRSFPECLDIKDGMGRTPLEILNERSLGRDLGIIKYMKTHARGKMAEDQRQETEEGRQIADEYIDHQGNKLIRRDKNSAVLKINRDRTMARKHKNAETMKQSRTTSMRPLNEQNPPSIVEQSLHFFNGDESLKFENDSSLSSGGIPRDSQMVSEMQQQRNLVESLLHQQQNLAESLQQQQNLVESLRSPLNPINIANPPSTYATAIVSPHSINNTSLHQLDAELSSMRNAHQSMSLLLSTKTQSENELNERLRNLEATYAQLKNEFTDLTLEHSRILTQLEEKSNEVIVLKSKEKGVSDELVLKLGVEDRQGKDINLLRSELQKEKEARVVAVENFESQTKRCADLEEIIQLSKSKSEQFLRDNDRFSMENKDYRAQLAQKNKQLQEAKKKEATLLSLLSKMHDIPSSSSCPNENEKLSTENSKLLKIIQETKANESKMKKLLEKSKGALIMSQRQNQQLQIQLNDQRIELQESNTNTSTLEEELYAAHADGSKMETSGEKLKGELEIAQNTIQQLRMQLDEPRLKLQESKTYKLELKEELLNQKCEREAEELRAKNIALREVALKAIETVGMLHRKIPNSHLSSCDSNSDSLKALLKKAEAASIDGATHSQVNSMLDASQSLVLLRPIVCDAVSFQQDSIERIQHLYQYFHDTMELITQISSIPHEHFQFQPTLQILEETVTSHVLILETLDDLIKSKEKHKSNLISLLNQEPRGERRHVSSPKTNTYANIESLSQGAISSKRVYSSKIISLAQHLETLEILSQTVAKLPRVKKIDIDAKREDVQLHLNKVDEITTVLNKALLILVHDARQMKAAYENVQIESEETNHD